MNLKPVNLAASLSSLLTALLAFLLVASAAVASPAAALQETGTIVQIENADLGGLLQASPGNSPASLTPGGPSDDPSTFWEVIELASDSLDVRTIALRNVATGRYLKTRRTGTSRPTHEVLTARANAGLHESYQWRVDEVVGTDEITLHNRRARRSLDGDRLATGPRVDLNRPAAPGTTWRITTDSRFQPVDPFAGLPFDRGQVVASDYALTPEAIDVWRYVSNGFHEGTGPYDTSTDTQIGHRTSGGDPLRSLGGQIHNNYRRLQTDGPQSRWDYLNQPNHTRSQLGGWGRYSTIHVSEQGDREFIVYSVRLDPDADIPGELARDHRGLAWLSMVSQFKSIGSARNQGPTFAVYEASDGLQLKVRETDGNVFTSVPDVPKGVWLRIGLDVLWSSDNDGAYRWWADLDGDTSVNFLPLTERRSTATIQPGFDASLFNIGPYHQDSVPTHGRDYANIEILRHPADDPWE